MIPVPFETLVDRAPIAYLIVGRSGAIEYANRGAVALLGYEREELLHMVVEDLLPERLRTRHEHYRAGFFADPQDRRMGVGRDLVALSKAGEEVPVEVGLSPLQGGEEPLIAVSLVGIADRLQQQEVLARNSRLDSIGFLAGGLAHDFNNVLGAILGNVDLLVSSLTLSPSDLVKVQRIHKVISHGTEVARRLVTFAKGGSPMRRLTDVGRLVEQAAHLAATGTNVAVSCRLASDLHQAYVDETQITQAITNFVINASQAMPHGGTVTVEAANVSFGADKLGIREGDYLHLVISDDGPGVPPAVRDKIFEPFFTTKATGHGLGLATTHSIFQRHGGLVVLRDTESGAVFDCYLPSATTDRSPLRSEEATDTDAVTCTDTGRVLILDDQRDVRAPMAEYLRSCGFTVDEAESGTVALAMIEQAALSQKPYSAAVLDVSIPGDLGGREIAQTLRKARMGIVVVLMTGYTEVPVEPWPESGIHEVLAKPFALSTLSATLSQWLHSPEVKRSDDQP